MDHQTLSFEDAFGILEQTVRDLEGGNLTVEDAVKLYERGMDMARLCASRLDSAELRISQLAESSFGNVEILDLDI